MSPVNSYDQDDLGWEQNPNPLDIGNRQNVPLERCCLSFGQPVSKCACRPHSDGMEG